MKANSKGIWCVLKCALTLHIIMQFPPAWEKHLAKPQCTSTGQRPPDPSTGDCGIWLYLCQAAVSRCKHVYAHPQIQPVMYQRNNVLLLVFVNDDKIQELWC